METLRSNPAEAGRELPPPLPPRRRRVRQKVHSPAYASLNENSKGQVLDLSEIVDISEDGMAIQTSFPLQIQRSVNLCLDLTATRARIYTAGEVIWCDGSGRVGISFPPMPAASLRQLKEWLFVNMMIACVNYRADLLMRQPLTRDQSPAHPLPPVVSSSVLAKPTENNALTNWMRQELEPTAPADYTSILTALAAVKREVDSLGFDLDRALELLAQRAQTFTRASGAAIALTDGAGMSCRASAGPDAPGVGARFNIGSGFSGECVRTGQTLRCDDSESDPLVDRESCRQLGIRSMIAVPVRWDASVIGLLEVFSPEPYAFNTNHPIALNRLAEMVSTAVYRAGASRASEAHRSPESSSAPSPSLRVDDEFPVETLADLPVPHFSRARRMLLAAAALTVVFAGSWLISPRDVTRSSASERVSAAPSTVSPKLVSSSAAADGTLESMRKLAEQGDPVAQFSVGSHYATGEGVPQDYAEAVRWFSLAAEQGHVVSQATLGAYYYAGRGLPQPDLVKAYFWSVLAQAGGDEASKYRLPLLASRLPRDKIVAVQQQADDWIKEHQSLTQNSPAPR